MIISRMINDYSHGRLSVAYSPTINLPQINSDNDNSVRARSSTRDDALIVNANVRSRECGLAARQNRFRCKNGTLSSATVQYDTRSC